MKLNNPATWFMVGAAALVGVAIFAGGGRAAYAENNCQRIVFKSNQAIQDALDTPAMQKRMEQIVTLGLTEGKDVETISAEIFDEVMAQLVPGCPRPLPENAVIYNMETDLTMDVASRRALFIDFMAPLLEAGQAGAASPFLSLQPALRAAFQ